MNPFRFLFLGAYKSVILSLALFSLPTNTAQAASDWREVELSQVQIKPGKSTLQISVNLPEAHHLTAEAPAYVKWKSGNESVMSFPGKDKINPNKSKGRFKLKTQANTGQVEVDFEAKIYYCTDDMRICYSDFMKAKLPVLVTAQAPSEVSVNLDVKLPT